MLKLNQITKTYTVGDLQRRGPEGNQRRISEKRIRISAGAVRDAEKQRF